ncbi:MAG: hypothetical protein ACN6OP_20280, partial [Pseudomonadales bacterium]
MKLHEGTRIPEGLPATQRHLAAYAAKKHLPPKLQKILSLADFEAAARSHLPRPLFGYISGAAEDGISLNANRN